MTNEDSAPQGGNRHRIILAVMALIFLAPTLGAWILFNFTDMGRGEAARANHGNLIVPPRKIDDVVLIDPQNSGRTARLYGKWNIVYLAAGECDKACEYNLYTMRQLRLAMGRDAERLQRVLVVYGGFSSPLSVVQTDAYKGQLLVSATEQMRNLFKLTDAERPLDLRRLYIIDPLGNLMMSFPEGADPEGIIKDLKRLLKYSSIG